MSTPPSSLSLLRSSDRLTISSPLFAPSSKPFRDAPPAISPSAHRCSISSCSQSTTAPPIPTPFLPLAVLCFPSTASTKVFTDKSPVWLCHVHRERLEEYRRLAVGHAEQSLDAWQDMGDEDRHSGSSHAKEDTPLYVMSDEESSRLLIGAPLIQHHGTLHSPPLTSSPSRLIWHPPSPVCYVLLCGLGTARFSCPTYSTFPSASAALSSFASAELCEVKPQPSVSVRLALAGGWLCTVSFLALWLGYTVLNVVHLTGH